MDIFALWPSLRRVCLDEVDSTNTYLKAMPPNSRDEVLLVTAEHQNAGRGAASNKWESEQGKNLTMSLLLHPNHIEATRQFVLTEVISLAICDTLNTYCNGFLIKWPNDIYHGDSKVVGILIENKLRGKCIEDCIMGIGINVNQTVFLSDAPNPSSLRLILGWEVDREQLLSRLLSRLHHYYSLSLTDNAHLLHTTYLNHLYRKDTIAEYSDEMGLFCASLLDVEPTGHLVLRDTKGLTRRYEFKQVKFIIKD